GGLGRAGGEGRGGARGPGGWGRAAGGRGGGAAFGAARGGERWVPPPLRAPRGPSARRAGPARQLVRGGRVRALAGRAPPERSRMGGGRGTRRRSGRGRTDARRRLGKGRPRPPRQSAGA